MKLNVSLTDKFKDSIFVVILIMWQKLLIWLNEDKIYNFLNTEISNNRRLNGVFIHMINIQRLYQLELNFDLTLHPSEILPRRTFMIFFGQHKLFLLLQYSYYYYLRFLLILHTNSNFTVLSWSYYLRVSLFNVYRIICGWNVELNNKSC